MKKNLIIAFFAINGVLCLLFLLWIIAIRVFNFSWYDTRFDEVVFSTYFIFPFLWLILIGILTSISMGIKLIYLYGKKSVDEIYQSSFKQTRKLLIWFTIITIVSLWLFVLLQQSFRISYYGYEDFHYTQMRQQAEESEQRKVTRNVTERGAEIAIGDWRGFYDAPKDLIACEHNSMWTYSHPIGWPLYDYERGFNEHSNATHYSATYGSLSIRGFEEDKCKLRIGYPYIYCFLNTEQTKEVAEYYQTFIDTSIREYGDAILHIVDQWGKKQYSIEFPDKLVQGDIMMPPKPSIILENPFEKLIANGDCKRSSNYMYDF